MNKIVEALRELVAIAGAGKISSPTLAGGVMLGNAVERARAALAAHDAQPAAEPVGHFVLYDGVYVQVEAWVTTSIPLYTHPAQPADEPELTPKEPT